MEELVKFVKFIEQNGISQGSEEWLVMRKTAIGGSQMSTVDGSNQYSTLKTLLYEKTGILANKPTIKMAWGILFEGVIKEYVEKDKNTKIIGENMFINTHPHMYYSPDGFAIIGGITTLLEFKAPYSRIPNKKIPIYYIPQMLMGMCLVPIASQALYAEAVFRRCSPAQLDFTRTFDRGLQKTGTGKVIEAIGYIIFLKNGPETNEHYEHDEQTDEYVEMWNCSEEEFFNILKQSMSGAVRTIYSKVYVRGDKTNVRECLRNDMSVYGANCTERSGTERSGTERSGTERSGTERSGTERSGTRCVAVLPWKLLRIDYHTIESDLQYLPKYEEVLTTISIFLKSLDYSAPADETKKAIDEFVRMIQPDDTGFDDIEECDDVEKLDDIES